MVGQEGHDLRKNGQQGNAHNYGQPEGKNALEDGIHWYIPCHSTQHKDVAPTGGVIRLISIVSVMIIPNQNGSKPRPITIG